jgi:hypothetical protein
LISCRSCADVVAVWARARRRRYAYATRAPAPSGKHLQYSILGKTSKLASLKHRRFLIPKAPRFEPAALIGAYGHCVRSDAMTGFCIPQNYHDYQMNSWLRFDVSGWQ